MAQELAIKAAAAQIIAQKFVTVNEEAVMKAPQAKAEGKQPTTPQPPPKRARLDWRGIAKKQPMR
ncbi:hypothetical protein MMC28_008535 [Mycoblastus sanguinarius]|nr:hypothetical protein [Mycoblastus sanguinarius]